MKKTIKSILLMAVAAMASGSCAHDEIEADGQGRLHYKTKQNILAN